MSEFPGKPKPVPAFGFMIHPSWFGGEEEANKAIAELAEFQARHESKLRLGWPVEVADIKVRRYGYVNADTWNVDVEFAI